MGRDTVEREGGEVIDIRRDDWLLPANSEERSEIAALPSPLLLELP